MEGAHIVRSALQPSALEAPYVFVRQSSESLCESLSEADATVQVMPYAYENHGCEIFEEITRLEEYYADAHGNGDFQGQRA